MEFTCLHKLTVRKHSKHTHTHTYLPQGWECQDTLPGPDEAAGSGSGRSGTVFPNTPSVCPCFLLRLMRLWEHRHSGLMGFPAWLWSWEDHAPLIEPGWAQTGLVPSLSSAPPSAPRPPLLFTVWFTVRFSHCHTLSPFLLYSLTHVNTCKHFALFYLYAPPLTSFYTRSSLPVTPTASLIHAYLFYPNIINLSH